jgi:hypothetical protein
MIVAIIGRLVTPQPVVFFRANCEYLPMSCRAADIRGPCRRQPISSPGDRADDVALSGRAARAATGGMPPFTGGRALAAGSAKCFVFADKQYCQ